MIDVLSLNQEHSRILQKECGIAMNVNSLLLILRNRKPVEASNLKIEYKGNS